MRCVTHVKPAPSFLPWYGVGPRLQRSLADCLWSRPLSGSLSSPDLRSKILLQGNEYAGLGLHLCTPLTIANNETSPEPIAGGIVKLI